MQQVICERADAGVGLDQVTGYDTQAVHMITAICKRQRDRHARARGRIDGDPVVLAEGPRDDARPLTDVLGDEIGARPEVALDACAIGSLGLVTVFRVFRSYSSRLLISLWITGNSDVQIVRVRRDLDQLGCGELAHLIPG